MSDFASVPLDQVRDYWNRRPCNLRHSKKEVGTREYFDEVEARKYFVEPHIPGFADFSRWKGKRVLEIGCGLGTDTINFARAGADVVALDYSDVSLDLASKRAWAFGLSDRIRFVHGDAEGLGSLVPDGPYDLVYSFGVIHHTPHPERVISEIRKLMGPGSELRLMVYAKISYKTLWLMHMEGPWEIGSLDPLVAKNSEAQTGCPVTYTYTRGGLDRLLPGFEITEAKKSHIFTWDIEHYVRHEYVRDKAWQGVSERDLAEWEEELGWHYLVKAKLKA